MARLDAAWLLHQARDIAESHPDEDARREALEAVAASALDQGLLDLAREVLLKLEDPGGRAWLHAELAERCLEAGEPTSARHHLDAACDALLDPGRWRPRGPRWMGPEAARARLCALHARLGARREALLLAGTLPVGRMAAAQAWTAIAEQSLRLGGPALAEDWRQALEAVLAVTDPALAREARAALAAAACRQGDATRALDLLEPGRTGRPLLEQALLVEAIADVLASAGFADPAQQAWEQAVDLLLGGPVLDYSAAGALCRIAGQQLHLVGLEEALATMGRAVERAATEPLSPEPDLRYAWRVLYEASLDEPALAGPLRDLLRGQPRVPPGWCYVLGLLELATGQLQRARWAAEALERGYELNPEDPESLWLAAVLWLRCGEGGPGLKAARTLLGCSPPVGIVELPGGRPDQLERVLGAALLQAGLHDPALALARGTEDPGLRAELLVQVALLARGGGEQGRCTILEAAAAVAEVDPATLLPSLGSTVGELLVQLERLGEPAAAIRCLNRTLIGAAQIPASLAISSLGLLRQRIEEAGEPMEQLLDRVDDALLARIGQESPVEQPGLLVLAVATTRSPRSAPGRS